MKRKYNFGVHIKQCRNNQDLMIKRFIKKTKKSKIIDECKDRSRYKKPSVRKKEKRLRAARARARELQIKHKRRQRRDRKD